MLQTLAHIPSKPLFVLALLLAAASALWNARARRRNPKTPRTSTPLYLLVGAWLLLGFIPLVGDIVLLFFLIQEGDSGPNRYGAVPPGVP